MKLGNVFIDRVFLVSPQLITLAILAVDSFTNTCAIVNFPERYALFKADGETTIQLFDVAKDDSAMFGANLASGCTERGVYRMSDFPLKTSASPPIKLTTVEQHRAVGSESSIVLGNEGMGYRESHAKCSDAILHCNEDDTVRGSCKSVMMMMMLPPAKSNDRERVDRASLFHCQRQ